MEYSKVKVLSCNDVSLKATGNPGTLEHWGEAEQRTSDWRPLWRCWPQGFPGPIPLLTQPGRWFGPYFPPRVHGLKEEHM